MADLATITIPVDSSAMVRAVKDAKNLERGIKMLVDAFDSGTIGSQQLSKGLLQLKRQYEGLFGTSQKATASVRGHAKSLQESKAAALAATAAEERLTLAKKKAETAYALGLQRAREEERQLVQTQAEILRLESMYNKVSVAARVYQQAQESLSRAVALGVISADQQEAKLAELSVAYQKVGADANKAQAFINRFGENAQVSGRGLNQFGMYAQQVGYQVGDFLVQIQSGTNFLVAFGQQATQLAGLFPGVLGAALGIGISLATAIGAAFMRTREGATSAAEGILTLADAQKQLNEASGDYALKLEMLRFGVDTQAEAVALKSILDLTKQIRDLNKEYQETDSLSRRQAIAEEVQALKAQLSAQQEIVDEVNAKKEAYEKALAINEQMLAVELGHARAAGQTAAAAKKIDFSSAVSSAAQLAQQLGISVSHASRMLAMGFGKGKPVVFDPRDPNYNPIAAEMERIRGDYGSVSPFDPSRQEKALRNAAGGAKKLKDGLEEATKAAEELRRELEAPLVNAVGSISDAFGDFVARGLRDFKGFVKSILGSFQSMIAQMIAMAVKNRIMLSLGIGGITPGMAAAGQVAGLGSAGGMLGSLGIGKGIAGLAGGTGFLGGAGNAIAGLGGGGAGFFSIGANAAAAGAGGVATFASTIGAAIPVIAAVALAIGFFKKRVKELDSGLRVTVSNMGALVETFKTLETKRFFGLSKKVTTDVEQASAEISDPIVKAVQDIQGQIIKAAGAFGFAEDTFKDFLYNFEVSLKGLSEDQKIQKVNEELAKMGDSFAALTGHFETMNELLEAANQRMELQNRLDTLLGNNQAVLQRQREAEIAATHELNRPLLTAIHTLEDAQSAVTSAFAALRSAIDRTVEDLQKKLSVANEAVNRSRGIFQQLENALSGRYLRGSDSQFSMRREGALSFLRRGNFSDERQLEEALGVVAEPTEDLFGSFEDYARDFYATSRTIEEAKKIAGVQLSADERQVAILERQIENAQNQYDLMMQQYNQLVGINTGVVSVQQALQGVQMALTKLGAAQQAATAAQQTATGAGTTATQKTTKDIINELYKSGGYSTQNQETFNKWVDYANKYGAQAAVQQWTQLGNKGSVSKFAMGGMHSGGLRIVGEQGPELESTGPSRIFSNRQTAELFRDPELANSVTELKNEVSRMRSEQLQIQLEISKNTKRIYDTERKWDVEGLPPERV